jgi:hypothetical protein
LKISQKYIWNILIVLVGYVSLQAATYPSFHAIADAQYSLVGFSEQIKENKTSMTMFQKIVISYDAKCATGNSEDCFNKTDANWCYTGETRWKIFVPKDVKSFSISFVSDPNTSYILHLFYEPLDGPVNNVAFVDTQVPGAAGGYDAWFNDLFNNGKVVLSTVGNTKTISFSSTYSKYWSGQDGWLYFSMKEGANVITSHYGHDVGKPKEYIQVNYKLSAPRSQSRIDELLSYVPAGYTEPRELPLHVNPKFCNRLEYDLTTEPGAALSPEELCVAQSGLWENGACTSKAELDCRAAQGLWENGACTSKAELDCRADSTTAWYSVESTCLPLDQNITGSLQNQGTTLECDPYYANEEGWETYLNVNSSAQTAKSVKVTIDGPSNDEYINIDIQPGGNLYGNLHVENSKLSFNYYTKDASGVKEANLTENFDLFDTAGKIVIDPSDSDATTMGCKARVHKTNRVGLCPDGSSKIWSDYYGDYVCENASSSSSVSSAASSSVSSSYSPPPVGGGGTPSCTANQTLKFDDSVGYYCAPNGVAVSSSSTAVSSSSSSAQSSSSSLSSETGSQDYSEPVCEVGKLPSWSDANGGYQCVDDSSLTSASNDIQVLKNTIEGKRYQLTGILKQFGSSVYVLKTFKGNYYRLMGTVPNSANVFGWKEVPVSGTGTDKFALVYLGDWDNDNYKKFDWVFIDLEQNKLYKLNGLDADGGFKFYANPVDATFTIEKGFVTFK